NLIRDSKNFFQLMSNDDDGLSLVLHPAKYAEKVFDLLRRKHRRRLIKDQQLRISVKCFKQLNPLLLSDGKIFDRRFWIDIELQFIRKRFDLFVSLFEIKIERTARFCTQNN